MNIKRAVPLVSFIVAFTLTIFLLSILTNPSQAAVSERFDAEVITGKENTELTQPGFLKPEVSASIQNDTSLPLRELARVASGLERMKGPEGVRTIPRLTLPKAETESSNRQIDRSIVQNKPYGLNAMPTPEANFEGVSNVDGVLPPDTQGDIGYDPVTGKKYYMQWNNLSYAIWDVTDPSSVTQLVGPVDGNTLWTGFGGICETNNDGDPIVLYDHLANRWMASQFALNFPNDFHECIAVSQTGDPTSAQSNPWGIAYYKDDTVWIGDGWGDNTLYEYQPDGTATGSSHPFTWGPAYGPADGAVNWQTGMLWFLDVGGDNCIHEIDPDSGVTGNTICPGFSTSQRGLAYDPSNDTWFAGGWNDGMIHHFAADGTMLDEVNVGLAISGLAYNPDTQHLFAMVSDDPNPVYVLDAADDYNLVGQFSISGFDAYSGAGLEFDCDGDLWAVHQGIDAVYEVESGELTDLCAVDLPWLSEDPISGTVSLGANQLIDVTFDAGVVDQPGDYHARVKINNNTPYGPAYVPVTMTVNAPATWGKMKGTVESLGYCDAAPDPLPYTEVLFQNGTTASTTTDVNGNYSYWLEEGTYTVVISTSEHLSHTAIISVAAQMTTTHDASLRLLEPCVSLMPESLAVTIAEGYSETLPLTLIDSGALSTPFRIVEREGDYAPPALRPQVTAQANVVEEDKSDVGEGASFSPLASGGPDAFGYTYLDSTEPDGPIFEWIEIAPPEGGSGTAAGLSGIDDSYVFSVPVSFPFNFYGTDYTDLAFASNGTVYFEDSYLGFSNTPIPNTSGYGVNTFIAHFWDDLVVDGTGDVYYQDFGDMVVIEYYNVRLFGGSSLGSWEVILYDNGNILMQYLDTSLGDGSGATFGIQGDETTGLQYSYYAPAVSDGLAICFIYPGESVCGLEDVPWLSPEPITGTLNADSNTIIDVTFDTMTYTIGTYTAQLLVQTDDPAMSFVIVPITMTIEPISYGVEIAPPTATVTDAAGATVTHTVWVTNTGNVPDTFDLAMGGNMWLTSLSDVSVSLGAGDSIMVEAYVTVPGNALGNERDTATVTVTSQTDPSVSASSLLTTVVEPIYSMEMTADTHDLSGAPGETVTATITMTNTGNISDTYTMTMANTWPAVVDHPMQMTMEPGEGLSMHLVVTIPMTATDGMADEIVLSVTSAGDPEMLVEASFTVTAVEPVIYLPIIQVP